MIHFNLTLLCRYYHPCYGIPAVDLCSCHTIQYLISFTMALMFLSKLF